METLGSLVDKLSIVNIKIFTLEDIKRDEKMSDKQIADATKATNTFNTYRNQLISEIDKLFGNDNPNNIKLYGNEK